MGPNRYNDQLKGLVIPKLSQMAKKELPSAKPKNKDEYGKRK